MTQISKQNKLFLLTFIVFCTFIFINSYFSKKKDEVRPSEPIYADTYIPKGFVLIPIELANAETISVLFDNFTIIDLFTTYGDKVGLKVANKIKLLKAPLNKNVYAVLVEEALSNQIMKSNGPFWAVIQNGNVKAEPLKANNLINKIEINYHRGI